MINRQVVLYLYLAKSAFDTTYVGCSGMSMTWQGKPIRWYHVVSSQLKTSYVRYCPSAIETKHVLHS